MHEGAVAHGRVLFETRAASPSPNNAYTCTTCHATTQHPADLRLLPGAPLAGAVLRPSYWGGTTLDLLDAVNVCRHDFMDAQMPWQAADADGQALYAYLASLPADLPEAVTFHVATDAWDLPGGDAAQGKLDYAHACQTCHGAAHTGKGRLTARAPILPEQTLKEHASYAQAELRVVFVQKVRHGVFYGYGGTMPPFAREVLSDDRLAGLLTWLGVPQ